MSMTGCHKSWGKYIVTEGVCMSSPIFESINKETVEKMLSFAKEDYLHQVERQNIIVKRISLIFTISSVAITYELSNLTKLDWMGIISVVFLVIALALLIFVLFNLNNYTISTNAIDKDFLKLPPERFNLYLLCAYKDLIPIMRKKINKSFVAIKAMILCISVSVVLSLVSWMISIA